MQKNDMDSNESAGAKSETPNHAFAQPVPLIIPPLYDLKTIQVASQALVNGEENVGQGSMNSLMKEMFAKFKTS
jgi:hypothetical protein